MEYLEIAWRPEEKDDADDGPPSDPAREAALAQVARIRELMEGSATTVVLSAGAALAAGAIGLAACAATWAALAAAGCGAAVVLAVAPPGPGSVRALAAIWGAAFVCAAASEYALTKRAARDPRRGSFHVPKGSPLHRRMRLAYTAPLVAGAAGTGALVRAGALEAVPALWLLSYGAALLCAGVFSVPPVRRLGAALLAIGCGAAALPAGNLAFLAAGFGAAHLVYGAVVAREAARPPAVALEEEQEDFA